MHLKIALGTNRQITREWLKEQLVGDPVAANLHFGSRIEPHIRDSCRKRLESRVAQHPIPPQFYLTRRVQHHLAKELEQCSVVFVVGKGGRGKSLSIARCLDAIADNHLVSSHEAYGVTEQNVVTEVSRLRLPQSYYRCGDRSLSDVSKRLSLANESVRPLWIIDLDGIDEAPIHRAEFRSLITRCWARGQREMAPASVVVSCRASPGVHGKTELYSRWLNVSDPDLVVGVGYIELDDFDNDELEHAARLRGGRPEQRILDTLADGMILSNPHQHLVAGRILSFLRHPVVWGRYASMEEGERDGVLNGEPDHINRLAMQLCNRFLSRCETRLSFNYPRMLKMALRAVGRASRDSTMPHPHQKQLWDDACGSTLDLVSASMLYSECLAYGLIEGDRNGWLWSHQFVENFLASPTEGWE